MQTDITNNFITKPKIEVLAKKKKTDPFPTLPKNYFKSCIRNAVQAFFHKFFEYWLNQSQIASTATFYQNVKGCCFFECLDF